MSLATSLSEFEMPTFNHTDPLQPNDVIYLDIRKQRQESFNQVLLKFDSDIWEMSVL